jgi:hypothetical protein
MVISLPPTSAPGEGRQQHHLEGMPLGTRGGMSVEYNFPADGEYELTIGDMALAREVPRMEFENEVIALLDGKEIYRTNIGGEADHKAIDQLLDSAVEQINGRLRKIKFKATAGQHQLAVTFVQRSFTESDERIRTSALEGGQAGGGDKRGQQSAALVIVKKNCGVWLHNDTVLRLQVDDNPEPIKELKRLVDRWNERKPRAVTPECKP